MGYRFDRCIELLATSLILLSFVKCLVPKLFQETPVSLRVSVEESTIRSTSATIGPKESNTF